MADMLVVEDDLDGAEALGELLRTQGHDVRIAFDGEHGFELVRERAPDLILVDVELPRLSGPELALRIRSQAPPLARMPIVLISGSPDLERIAREAGIRHVLKKPLSYERVTSLIERVLSEGEGPPDS